MPAVSLESFPHERHESLGRTPRISIFTRAEARISPECSRLYDGFLLLRGQFARQEQWHANEDDADHYDNDPRTRYIVYANESDEVLAGFRLTPVDDIDESLSMKMWQKPLERAAKGRGDPEQTIELREAREIEESFEQGADLLEMVDGQRANGMVWDLTRLVTVVALDNYKGTSKESLMIYHGLLRLFGAGMAASELPGSGSQGVYWIFTASHSMQTFLEKNKIGSHEIAQGRISPSDQDKCSLRFLSVKWSFRRMKSQNPRSAQLVEEGYCANAAPVPTI